MRFIKRILRVDAIIDKAIKNKSHNNAQEMMQVMVSINKADYLRG